MSALTSFRLRGLDPAPFLPLFGASESVLAAAGAVRVRVRPGQAAPDRVSLRDVAAGRDALLINHEHQDGDTPYRARHAIYVEEGASQAFDAVDTLPPALLGRQLSLRAFSATHWLLDAALAVGDDNLKALISRQFDNSAVAYLQLHFAAPGCYAARVERASLPGARDASA
jgi:hypothetical protein